MVGRPVCAAAETMTTTATTTLTKGVPGEPDRTFTEPNHTGISSFFAYMYGLVL